MKKVFLVVFIFGLSACAVKQKVLDASAVSMTQFNLKEGEKLTEMGQVEGNFCADSSHRGSLGLMDEAIKNAQKKSNSDFILNATFYVTGQCMSVEGTAAKISK